MTDFFILLYAVGSFIIQFTIIDWIVKKTFKRFQIQSQRPSGITTLIILQFFGILISLFGGGIIDYIIGNVVPSAPNYFSDSFTIISEILGIIWIVGLLNMKRWAVIGMFLSVFATQVIGIQNGTWIPLYLGMFIPPIIASFYFSRMT